ncbi:MAG: hypothetical protein FJ398_26250, partial [Verrucomicrobia bacterium]|nr:hypothetical protein [Verrucomicrobiota bacterium]
MKPSALIPLLTLVSSHGTSAQSADWQSVTWREPQVRYLIADLFLGGTSVCTPSAWSPDGKWISFRRTDERYWSNKERMLKIYSEKPA